jgi:hypothetical protein
MTPATDPKFYFETKLPKLLASNPSWLPNFKYVVQFHVAGAQGGDWVVDGTASPPSVRSGRVESADVELDCSAPVFSALTSASLSPKQAFDMTQLKVRGLFGVAMKLGVLFTSPKTNS